MGPEEARASESVSLIAALLKGTKLVVAELTTIGKGFDISPDEWLVLSGLSAHEGLSMAEISAHSQVSGATLTRAVDRLVSKALVYREASAVDRRRIQVFLSPLGQQLHAEMGIRVDRLEDSLWAAGDLAQVVAGLDRIAGQAEAFADVHSDIHR